MIDFLRLARAGLARLLILAVTMLGAMAPAAVHAQQGPAVLVLYDAPAGMPNERLGRAYAVMLANLLGRWDAKLTVQPVHAYQSGMVDAHQATFYLGSYFDNPLPVSLLRELAQTARTVVWFRYNLWQLARVPGFDFETRWGFRWQGLRGLEGDPGAATPDFFDTVQYRGQSLRKYYAFDAAGQRVFADPDIGLTEIVDASRAQVLARIDNRLANTSAPYALRSGNFWYVADLPFSYIGPRDRYLVVADLLHDMLGVTGGLPPQPRALVRLEDVSAMTDPAQLGALAALLQGWQNPGSGAAEPIPFSIALINRYRDPLGLYNAGKAVDIRLRQASRLRSALNDALGRGGRLVMHGWTHQYSNVRNPWSAVSGDDFEFWDIVGNQPLPRDQLRDWRSYIDAALKDLAGAGYSAFAFETPHYQASPRAYRAVAERLPAAYERAVYYTDEVPRLNVTTPDRDFAVGQFFPYPLARDWYGRRLVPENIGNIEYDLSAIDPLATIEYGWEQLATNAAVLRAVVRDGVASFFFHPYLLSRFVRPDGTAYPIDGLGDFSRLLAAIQALGYRFIDPTSL